MKAEQKMMSTLPDATQVTSPIFKITSHTQECTHLHNVLCLPYFPLY